MDAGAAVTKPKGRPRDKSPIGETDLQEFLDSKADFAFEMRVLGRFEALSSTCEHGGTYTDPITSKIRQFDIRARYTRGPARLWIAAECKNVGADSPVLVHSVPRKLGEAFHSLIVHRTSHAPDAVTVGALESMYRPEELVGKRIDQVRKQAGRLIGGDQDIFERITQSVNSAFELVREAARSPGFPEVYAVVPVLVLPDGCLWQVDYSNSGEQSGPPHPVNTCPYFLAHEWQVATRVNTPLTYRLSHIEIITFGALKATISQFGDGTDTGPGLFHTIPNYIG